MSTFLKTVKKSVKHWYIPLIIGLVLVAMGIYIFTVPLATYGALTILFIVSFLVSGLLEIVFAIENRKTLEGWGWYLAGGIFTLIVGIVLYVHPGISLVMLPFFVAFALLFRSFQGLGFALEMKNHGQLRWGNLAIASVLGIVFSLLLLLNPLVAGLSIVIMTATAFIFAGIANVVLSFQLRKLKKSNSDT